VLPRHSLLVSVSPLCGAVCSHKGTHSLAPDPTDRTSRHGKAGQDTNKYTKALVPVMHLLWLRTARVPSPQHRSDWTVRKAIQNLIARTARHSVCRGSVPAHSCVPRQLPPGAPAALHCPDANSPHLLFDSDYSATKNQPQAVPKPYCATWHDMATQANHLPPGGSLNYGPHLASPERWVGQGKVHCAIIIMTGCSLLDGNRALLTIRLRTFWY
jgi:hypothetical protein